MKETQKIANDGKTTLKRAMEIMQYALPVFKAVWRKSQDVVEVDPKVVEEIRDFEIARSEVDKAGCDIEKRKAKSAIFKTHIGKNNTKSP